MACRSSVGVLSGPCDCEVEHQIALGFSDKKKVCAQIAFCNLVYGFENVRIDFQMIPYCAKGIFFNLTSWTLATVPNGIVHY